MELLGLVKQHLLTIFEKGWNGERKTPMTPNVQLRKATENDECFDQTLYHVYLSTRTRPDIAFAVSNVARFCSKPTKEHWTAIKRIMRYLRGTTNLGLLYTKSDSMECIGYSDADWGGDCNDHKSTSGFLVLVVIFIFEEYIFKPLTLTITGYYYKQLVIFEDH